MSEDLDIDRLMLDADAAITRLFARVHPVLGDHARCATGEPYITYAIATTFPELSVDMVVNTFRQLTQGCANIKPEGAPVMLDDRKPRYLYWRRKLELQRLEFPNHPGEVYFECSCRAVVSLEWREVGQITKDVRRLSPRSLEALAIAVRQAESDEGFKIGLSMEDALAPWIAEQFPKGLR